MLVCSVLRIQVFMKQSHREVVKCPREFAQHGLNTIRSRHTCAHRVDELLAIDAELRHPATREVAV